MDGLRVAWRSVPEGVPRRDVAWGLLRELTGATEITNPCPFCGGPHGPVQLPGSPWRASVSYADGLAVVGVVPTADAAAFGIDAEGAATPGARAWTRIEAALKADGRGMRIAPESVRVTENGDGWTAIVPSPDGRAGQVYHGLDVPAADGVLISVAALP